MNESYDIVFSDATLQWIPNHKELLLRLFNIVQEKGALAAVKIY
jgi:trans-aconitate methyltransferase